MNKKCEKRIRRIKKGSQKIIQREARRCLRLSRTASPTSSEESIHVEKAEITAENEAQNRILLELAWKTVTLLQRNRLIQEKIVELQKETSDFVATVMSVPENKQKCEETLKLYHAEIVRQIIPEEIVNLPLKSRYL